MFVRQNKKQSSKVPRSLLPKKRLSRVSKRSGRLVSDEEVAVRRTRWQWTSVYAFLWFLFLGSCSYILFFSPSLIVRHVRVEGTQSIDNDQVQREVLSELHRGRENLFRSDNLLVVSPRSVRDRLLQKFTQARTIEVKRVFPDTLRVHIRERETKLVWCSGGPCFLIDEEGYAYTGVDEETMRNLPERILKVVDISARPLNLSEPVVGTDFLNLAALAREQVKQELDMNTEQESSTPSRLSLEIRLKMQDGWILMLDAQQPLEKSLRAVALLLKKGISKEDQQRLRYVDARTSRLYYTLEGAEVRAEESSVENVSADAEEKQTRPSEKD